MVDLLHAEANKRWGGALSLKQKKRYTPRYQAIISMPISCQTMKSSFGFGN